MFTLDSDARGYWLVSYDRGTERWSLVQSRENRSKAWRYDDGEYTRQWPHSDFESLAEMMRYTHGT